MRAGAVILGAESWRPSFLSVLAASWVFLLSILAFVFSIICSWGVTWGEGERWEAEEEREADTVSSLLCALLSAVL